MLYTHAQITDLVQHTIATTTGYGCSLADAETVITDWQRTA